MNKNWKLKATARRLAPYAMTGLFFFGLVIAWFLPNPFVLRVIVLTAISAIALFGLNFVTGLTGQVSLCQAALCGAGAYFSGILGVRFGFPFWFSLPLACLLTGLLGFVLSVCTVKMRAYYLSLATIGFGEILANFYRTAESWTGGANGLSGIPAPVLGSWTFDNPKNYLLIAFTLMYLGFIAISRIVRSHVGITLVALRDNEIAAASIGVNTVRLKIFAFVIGAMYAGASGALYAHFDGFIGPESFSTVQSILYLCVSVVGGLGRPVGSIIGALILVIGQEYFRSYSQYQVLLFGILVIVIMIFAPRGIAGIFRGRRSRADEKETPVRPSKWSIADHSLISAPLRDTVLEARDLRMHFGGITALDDISFDVFRGEILCIIGPNGAGKTTLLNVIGGEIRPDSGTVLSRGRAGEIIRLVNLPIHSIARHGMTRTFQTSQLFPDLTVVENIIVGFNARSASGPSIIDAFFRPWESSRRERSYMRFAMRLARSMGLWKHRNTPANQLPFGLRRILEIARSLSSEPFILLLDEPSAGMNEIERKHLSEVLKTANASGLTIMLVAHDLKLVQDLADRVIVLNQGKMIFSGPSDEFRNDAKVVAAYLGNLEMSHVRN
ncbi:branched-chain amino acid ABC transporter ATP-binding protein/permease [bacterium]|nr:branched-chain amino acid ABC transporter ATP-binding protein/permease [bacterium]